MYSSENNCGATNSLRGTQKRMGSFRGRLARTVKRLHRRHCTDTRSVNMGIHSSYSESGIFIAKSMGKSGTVTSLGCCFPPKFANPGTQTGVMGFQHHSNVADASLQNSAAPSSSIFTYSAFSELNINGHDQRQAILLKPRVTFIITDVQRKFADTVVSRISYKHSVRSNNT